MKRSGPGENQSSIFDQPPEPPVDSTGNDFESLPGPSVNLVKRANFLTHAISEYSTASSRQGLIDGILSGHPVLSKKYGERDVDRYSDEVVDRKRAARAAIRAAYGAKSIIDAGYDSDSAAHDEQEAVYNFERIYGVGGDKKKARDKYRKQLEKFIK